MMRISNVFVAGVAGLVSVLGAPEVAWGQEVVLLERFDADQAGWTGINAVADCEPIGVIAAVAVPWREGAGLPGGSISIDEPSRTGFRPVLVAGSAFTGDLSAGYGGFLTYDRHLLPDASFARRDDVRIEGLVSGVPVTLVADTVGAARREWTNSWVPLSAGNWTIGTCDGPLASEAQLRGVLENVTGIYFSAEYRSGAETCFVDNVMVLGPSDAPTSTFDTDLEGWGVVGDADAAWFDEPSGSPRCMRAVDRASGVGYDFTAPATFLGDQRAALGKTLSFDFRVNRFSSFGDRGAAGFVRVEGSSGQTLRYHNDHLPIATEHWLHQFVPLAPSPAWTRASDGAQATMADFDEVFADVSRMLIRGEYRTGEEEARLDTVVLGACVPSVVAALVDTDEPFALATLEPGDNLSVEVYTAGDGPMDHTWQVESPEGSGLFVSFDAGEFVEPDTGFGFTAAIDASGMLTLSDPATGTRTGGEAAFRVVVAGRCGNAKSNEVEVDFSCRADLDDDGFLTIFDFIAFQNAFDAMDPVADFDGDGAFTIFDFLAFSNAFDLGCP